MKFSKRLQAIRNYARNCHGPVLELFKDKIFTNAAKNRTLHYTTDYSYVEKPRDWSGLPKGNIYENMIRKGDSLYASLIERFGAYSPKLSLIPKNGPDEGPEPYWDNGWFPPGDAIALYCLLAVNNPKTYIEVGSGNSTKFARRSIVDNGLRTKIISLDPHPRKEIDSICDEVIRVKLEDADLSVFGKAGDGDMVFVDCSHRSYQNSDVTVYFTEVLPFLPGNILWGLHDIFLPADYPAAWSNTMSYNEQYLLMSYLLGGGGDDRIEFPAAYITDFNPDMYKGFLASFAPAQPWGDGFPNGGSFWMRRAKAAGSAF